jgi:hypothetical protein
MFKRSKEVKVIELQSAPHCEIGAPLPSLLANDYRLLLAYIVRIPNPAWDGRSVKVISDDTETNLWQ